MTCTCCSKGGGEDFIIKKDERRGTKERVHALGRKRGLLKGKRSSVTKLENQGRSHGFHTKITNGSLSLDNFRYLGKSNNAVEGTPNQITGMWESQGGKLNFSNAWEKNGGP